MKKFILLFYSFFFSIVSYSAGRDPYGVISASASKVCPNTSVDLTTNLYDYTGAVLDMSTAKIMSYTWYSSTDQTNWTALTSSAYTSCSPSVPSGTNYYYLYMYIRFPGASGWIYYTINSNIISTSTYPVYSTESISYSSSFNPICYNTTPSRILGLYSGCSASDLTFKWESSLDNSSWSDAGGTNSEFYPSTLTQSTYFRRYIASVYGCKSEYSNVVTIGVYGQVSAGEITSLPQTICYNTIPNPITSNASSGGSTRSDFWQYSSDNSNWTTTSLSSSTYFPSSLIASKYYRKGTTSANSCGSAYSGSVLITVLPNLLAGSITGTQTICYDSQPSKFDNNTSPSGGDGNLTIYWQKSTDGTNYSLISSASSDSYQESNNLKTKTYYKRYVSSYSCTPVSTSAISVSVYSQLYGGTIGVNQTVCYNSVPSSFTSVSLASGATSTFQYKWQKCTDNINFSDISEATLTTYSEVSKLTQTTYYRRAAINATCGTVYSNTITVTVYPEITGGTIGDNQTICYNSKIYTLANVTLPTGGTGDFVYSWQKSTDGGYNYDVIAGANAYSYTEPSKLTSTTYYKRIATSGSCSPMESNIVTITVYPDLIPGTIGANQTICYNSLPSGFTNILLASGGDGNLTYLWKKSEDGLYYSDIINASNSVYTENLSITKPTYYKRVVSSSACGTKESNVITVSVFNEFLGGTIGSDQTICYNSLPSSFTSLSLASGASSSIQYKWQKSTDNINFSDISEAALNSYSVVAKLTTTTYYRRVAMNATCGTVYSNTITVTVNPEVLGGKIGDNQTICYNSKIYTLANVTLPTGGTGDFVYSWQKSTDGGYTYTVIEGANGASYTEPSNLTSSTFYKRVVTSGGCPSVESNIITITVYPDLIPGTIGANQTICYNTQPSDFTTISLASGGDGNLTYLWKKSEDGSSFSDIINASGSVFSENSKLLKTTSYKRIVLSTACGTKESNVITVNVLNQFLGGTVGTDQTVCIGNIPNTFTNIQNPSGADNAFTYIWAKSTDGGNTYYNISGAELKDYSETLPLSISAKYKRITVSSVCGKAESNEIVVSLLSDFNPGIISPNQTLCYNGTATAILASSPSGGTVYSFNWQVSSNNGLDWFDASQAEKSYTYPSNVTSTVLIRRLVTSEKCKNVSSNVITLSVDSVKADFSFSVDLINITEGVQFTNNCKNASKYYWNFYEDYSNLANPWVYFYSAGQKSISLTVTSPLGCKDSITKRNVITVNNPNATSTLNKSESILIYPNPVSDLLHFVFSEVHLYTIELFDISGRLVFSKQCSDKAIDINISNLSSGLYHLNLIYDQKVITKKIIKK